MVVAGAGAGDDDAPAPTAFVGNENDAADALASGTTGSCCSSGSAASIGNAFPATTFAWPSSEAEVTPGVPSEGGITGVKEFGIVVASEVKEFGIVVASEVKEFGIVVASEVKEFGIVVASEVKEFGIVVASEVKECGMVESNLEASADPGS